MAAHDEAERLLSILNPTREGLIELRLIRKADAVLQKFFGAHELGRAGQQAVEMRHRGDVYFGVAPRTRREGTKDAIAAVPAIWADIDDETAVSSLDEFPLAPTAVVSSGSGVHAYWVLDDAIEPAHAESLLRRLAVVLGSDECVTDASRVLRVPGTLNHKTDPPRRVELLELHADRVYRVEDVERRLPDDPQAGTRERRLPRPGAPSAAVQRVLDRLEGPSPTGNGWIAICPAHDDHQPSLSIGEGGDGRCLINCFAGCAVEDVVAAVDLEVSELFPGDSRGRRRGASRLIALAEGVGLELFHTPAGTAHAAIPVGGHCETWRLSSPGFALWLRRLHYEHSGEALRAELVSEAVATLEARALFDGDEREVYRRVAGDRDRVLIDMGDAAWRTIEVTAEGWTVTDRPDVHFVRDRSTLPLPDPVPGGSLDELRSLINCASERSFLLLVGSLVMCFHPAGPYPVTYLTGEQGSAKSTASRAMFSLSDPRKAPLAMGNPSVRDLAAIANSVWVVGFDNVSRITRPLSDALCQLVTGAGYRARELYTDGEAFTLELKRPVLMNGIGQVADRPDLLDRVALIELSPIPGDQRRTEDDFWAAWNAARPRLLGALLEGVASALLNAPDLELDGHPRLADFARWGEGAGIAWGWEPGAFTAALESGREDLLEGGVDAYPEIVALIEFMEKRGGDAWLGSASELLARLGDIAGDVAGSQAWPKRADTLSNRLVEHAPVLRQHGIEVHRGREAGGNRKRFLRITMERDAGTRGDA